MLAGTDAHEEPGPTRVEHGTSLHHEPELLASAGLEPVELLRSATSLPAHHFGLADRGAVVPGLSADLILIDGAGIRATRALRRIWCGGVEISPAA